MAGYRWNQLDAARGYDAAAEIVHPYYRIIQDVLLEHMLPEPASAGLVVDLGGGSGRLAERILDRFPRASVWVIDQSEPFLTLARERLRRFDGRGICSAALLQSDWSNLLPEAPQAIVSMSAIHHLDPEEKRRLYRHCADCLAPGGVLINGDEVRPGSDEQYLVECRHWAEHMHREMDAGRVPEPLHPALLGWEARNVGQFDTPRASGDDFHETIAAQLEYYSRGGLKNVCALWQSALWAVLAGWR